MALTSEIFAIATFWFGGPWLSARIFDAMKWDKNLLAYLHSLTCCLFHGLSDVPAVSVGHACRRRPRPKRRGEACLSRWR